MPRPFIFILALAAGLLLRPVGLAAQDVGNPSSVPPFEFHSGFWVNLHHVLYLQGRARESGGTASSPSVSDFTVPGIPLDRLSAAEQQAWNASVAAYATGWSNRDLRNGDMALINDRLGELEDCQGLLEEPGSRQCISGLRPEMIAALNQAAPIYRARWWPGQDRANRAWIADVAPLVRRMGEVVGDSLIEVYHRRWPPAPIRVDVVGYAGPNGAYSTVTSVLHIMPSSGDPDGQGPAAFEVLIREASQPLAELVNQEVAEECRKQNKPIPREFLEALVSYTAGVFVQHAFAEGYGGADGTTYVPYTPYAFRTGLFTGNWSTYRDLLIRYWQPYLEGQLSLDVTVSRMVSSW